MSNVISFIKPKVGNDFLKYISECIERDLISLDETYRLMFCGFNKDVHATDEDDIIGIRFYTISNIYYINLLYKRDKKTGVIICHKESVRQKLGTTKRVIYRESLNDYSDWCRLKDIIIELEK